MRPHTITYPPDGVEPIGLLNLFTECAKHVTVMLLQWSISADTDIYVPLPICVDTEKTY